MSQITRPALGVSPKVAKRAVRPRLGAMMEKIFDAANLTAGASGDPMVRPHWLLIEKQELANKETGQQ